MTIVAEGIRRFRPKSTLSHKAENETEGKNIQTTHIWTDIKLPQPALNRIKTISD